MRDLITGRRLPEEHDRFRRALIEEEWLPGRDEHVASCASCSALAARLKLVDGLVSSIDVPQPPTHLFMKIRERTTSRPRTSAIGNGEKHGNGAFRGANGSSPLASIPYVPEGVSPEGGDGSSSRRWPEPESTWPPANGLADSDTRQLWANPRTLWFWLHNHSNPELYCDLPGLLIPTPASPARPESAYRKESASLASSLRRLAAVAREFDHPSSRAARFALAWFAENPDRSLTVGELAAGANVTSTTARHVLRAIVDQDAAVLEPGRGRHPNRYRVPASIAFGQPG
jgi:hypothetical protein